jgi:hypothetical protein
MGLGSRYNLSLVTGFGFENREQQAGAGTQVGDPLRLVLWWTINILKSGLFKSLI